MTKVKTLTSVNFHSVVDSADLVMVDFGATWCQPCRALEPVVEQLADEVSYPIYKVDTDDSFELSQEFKIRSVPTIIVFKKGEVYKRQSGFVSKENLLKMFE